ncbi:MAG: hypothetical protein V4581_19285 [Bacteroidota bacterium]
MKHLIIILLAITTQLSAQSVQQSPAPLSAKQNAAYEAKAQSKVAEFYSYLELLTDPKGNAEMKQQALESADKLFITNTISDNILETKASGVPIASLLQSAKGQQKKHSFEIQDFSIQVISDSPAKKEWQMTYKLLKNGKPLNIIQLFFIVQEDKKFGNTTKKVTNTYLGAITIK